MTSDRARTVTRGSSDIDVSMSDDDESIRQPTTRRRILTDCDIRNMI